VPKIELSAIRRRNILNRRRIITLASSAAATAALFLIPAAPAYATTSLIKNPASGQMGCLQANGFEKDVQITTAFCDGNPLQAWIFDPVGFDNDRFLFHIRNLATGWCLTATSNRDFAPVEQIDCTSITNENWFEPGGGVIKSDISTGGTPCMDLNQGPSTSIPKPIDVFHCTANNAAQQFTAQQLT
jgi:hypothetical protein